MSIFNKAFGKGTVNPINQPAPQPVSSGGPIYGVDVYHGDDVESWAKVLASGHVFSTCKASEALFGDSKFNQYFNDSKKTGLVTGSYHFYSTGEDQVAQAKFYWNIIKNAGLEKTDFSPIFDFERSDGNFSSSDSDRGYAFTQEIASLSGRLPVVYMSESTPEALGNPAWLKSLPWWLARYRSLSQGPGIDTWVEWQFSESASVPGIGNPCDVDIYRGSLSDLKKFISTT